MKSIIKLTKERMIFFENMDEENDNEPIFVDSRLKRAK